jgi:hypothetical protein
MPGRSLVQKRQLLRPASVHDLGRRLADEVLQRSGEMRLVEVARRVNDVEDRHGLLEEGGCVPGALDPVHGALRQPGRPHKVSLCGAQGPLVSFTVQHGIDDGPPQE